MMIESAQCRLIDHSMPAGSTERAKAFAVPCCQESLGFAITRLLFEEGADREAPVVPDHGGGVECDDVAAVEQTPAKVDVVTGGVVLRLKAADFIKRAAPDGHVAAGDVLRRGVGQKYMRRTSRRG